MMMDGVNLGDQQSFGIKTSGLEAKATACQMLVYYAKELEKDLWTIQNKL